MSQSSFKWIPGEELSDSEYASKEEEHVFDHNRDSFMLASQYDTDEENDFSSRRVSGTPSAAADVVRIPRVEAIWFCCHTDRAQPSPSLYPSPFPVFKGLVSTCEQSFSRAEP